MKNNRQLAFAVGGIVAVVFSLSIFTLWSRRDGVFWITYLFLLLGIIGTATNAAFLKADNSHFASNLTLLTISIVYLIVCAVVSPIAILFGSEENIGYFILHIILFAVFLCIWLLARCAVNYINKQD